MTRAMAAMTAVRAPAFDPRNMGKLEMWLDARAAQGFGVGLPADGVALPQWNDLSGKDRHGIQATGVKQPILRSKDRNLLVDPNMDSVSGTIVTRTNMLTNPSVESSNTTGIVRTNLCPNPNMETDANNWLARGAGVATPTRVTTQAHGGTSSVQAVVSSVSGMDWGVCFGNVIGNMLTTTVGRVYTFSAWVRTDIISQVAMNVYWRDAAGTALAGAPGFTFGTPVATAAGTWLRVSVTSTAPAGAIYMHPFVAVGIACTVWIDDVLFEDMNTLMAYFDGTTAAAGDFTYAWLGTAHASVSHQKAPYPNLWQGATSSSFWVSSVATGLMFGTKSLGILMRGFGGDGMTLYPYPVGIIGRSYTFSMYVKPEITLTMKASLRFNGHSGDFSGADISCPANAWTRMSITAVLPSDGNGDVQPMIRSYLAHTGQIIYMDGGLLEESDVLLPYFDGAQTRIPLRRNLYVGATNNIGSGNHSFVSTVEQTAPGSAVTYKMTVLNTTIGQGRGITMVAGTYSPGRTYRYRYKIFTNVTGLQMSQYPYRNTPSGLAFTVSSPPTANGAVPVGVWTQYGGTVTINADTTGTITLGGYFTNQMAINDVAYWGGLQVEDITDSVPTDNYFDGSTVVSQGIAYSWNGTVGASISEQYCPDFTYGWVGTAHGTASQQKAPALVNYVGNGSAGNIPIVHQSSELALYGNKSAKVKWTTSGAAGAVTCFMGSGFTIGQEYTISGWFYVPTGSPNVLIGVYTLGTSAPMSTKNAWTRISHTFTATGTFHYLYYGYVSGASVFGDDVAYIDGVQLETGAIATIWTPKIPVALNRPLVQFDGIDDTFSTSAVVLGGPAVTVYAISYRAEALLVNPMILQHDDVGGNRNWLLRHLGTSTSFQFYSWDSSQAIDQISQTGPVVNTLAIASAHHNSQENLRINGGALISGIVKANPPKNASTPAWIASQLGTSSWLSGGICALLVFSEAHTDIQRSLVERWLGRVFGVTVA